MPRLSLKPDAGFFRNIAIGAVGTQAVVADLRGFGHEMAELERGSLGAKIWKEVRRKRVRFPDLVCTRCGQRVESRAKTDRSLAMSHSPTDEFRVWDFGMVDSDWVAFPICEPVQDELWTSGRLGSDVSYWHERNWIRWALSGGFSYFTVAAFRAVPPTNVNVKGVEAGSETSVAWGATFSTLNGRVEVADGARVTLIRENGRRQTWQVRAGQTPVVTAGEVVRANQVIAASVQPLRLPGLRCVGALAGAQIEHLISSRERTQRFTGIKLARLRREPSLEELIGDLAADSEEDDYIRLEGAAYLVSVCNAGAEPLFQRYLESTDKQAQLEAVISLGEAGTDDAVTILSRILATNTQPYFLRSAAAWALGQIGSDAAIESLVAAFSDVDWSIREEALEGIRSVGQQALPMLLEGIVSVDTDVAAGCAEALRQQQPLPQDALDRLYSGVGSDSPPGWAVWLLGNLPREHVAPAIAELQTSAPSLHYALSLLWAFTESWISFRWETCPGPNPPVRTP